MLRGLSEDEEVEEEETAKELPQLPFKFGQEHLLPEPFIMDQHCYRSSNPQPQCRPHINSSSSIVPDYIPTPQISQEQTLVLPFVPFEDFTGFYFPAPWTLTETEDRTLFFKQYFDPKSSFQIAQLLLILDEDSIKVLLDSLDTETYRNKYVPFDLGHVSETEWGRICTVLQ